MGVSRPSAHSSVLMIHLPGLACFYSNRLPLSTLEDEDGLELPQIHFIGLLQPSGELDPFLFQIESS